MQSLFAQFRREKQILKNATQKTLGSYADGLRAFGFYAGCTCVQHLTTERLKQWVITMSSAGLKPGSINSYASGVNSFLTWLHDNSHTNQRFRVPLARKPRRTLNTYSAQDVARIVAYKPASRSGRRVMTLLCLLIDTGCRINEALTLTRDRIDWDDLLVTLQGKGGKWRRAPISPECRKVLFRWVNSHQHSVVFCVRNGGPMSYWNFKRDFLAVLRAVGIEKSEGCFHAFRRFFGKSYLRSGGNPIYLQRLFGHESMAMTQQYVAEDAEDLKDAHRTLSPLEGLKKR